MDLTQMLILRLRILDRQLKPPDAASFDVCFLIVMVEGKFINLAWEVCVPSFPEAGDAAAEMDVAEGWNALVVPRRFDNLTLLKQGLNTPSLPLKTVEFCGQLTLS